jgi:VIT1/CCC1 family predicted Fe2+/Mn2+ transporter
MATPAPTPAAAFVAKDRSASRAAHDEAYAAAAAKTGSGSGGAAGDATEDHSGAGSEFVKSLVFGGLDGGITTFSIIASVAGGSLGIEAVLVLGFANLIADAISMGAGDYISSLAEYWFLQAEESRAGDMVASKQEQAARSVTRALVKKGLRSEDAAEIVSLVASNPDFYREFLLVECLEQEVPGDPLGPAKDGAVCFFSFLVFGSVPLWVYVAVYGAKYTNVGGTFGISAMATAFSLFALGCVQGHLTRQSRWRAGLFMSVNGMLAGAAAYLISWGIETAIGYEGEC